MSTKEKHLYYLSELKDYKINHNDTDIRGWHVKDLDNRVIGKVDNLLVNKELGKVVYVDVEVDQSIIDTNHDPYSAAPDSQVKEFINKEGENHVIVPVGLIDLNRDDKYVYTESINYQTFAETKRYRSGSHISRDYERHVLGSYDRHPDRDRDREHRNRELRRTSSAYSDEDLSERERIREQEALEREDGARHRNRNTDTEERIRREKENLRYTSDDRKGPATNTRYSDNLNPERTLDEEENWEHDEPRYKDDASYQRRKSRKNYDDDFYDRDEFQGRDYR